MTLQTGNLTKGERTLSALFGMTLSLLALRRGNPLLRAAAAATAGSLLARAAAGHCAVKSAVLGHTSIREGLTDQWRRISGGRSASRHGLPGSPAHSARSQAVDDAVEESFPASDPRASSLPDEPPVNAEAKWAAALGNGSEQQHKPRY